MQPYTGNQRLVVETRHADGSLDVGRLSEIPRELVDCTFDQLYQAYFRAVPDGVGDWPQLQAWLTEKGWSIRPRTW